MTSRLRLHIDRTACDGRGLCMELLPELLTSDDWGYPVVGSARGAAVPQELIGDAHAAARACPLRALHLLPAE